MLQVLSVGSAFAEAKRVWVVVAKNVASAQEDLYVDTNFREKINEDAFMISTLSDTRGVQFPVEIFGDDGKGGTTSVLLTNKKYRSVISLEVFSCKTKQRGTYLAIYRSEPMGKGKTIYREENAEARGERGDFIPLMPLLGFAGEASLLKFACSGRL